MRVPVRFAAAGVLALAAASALVACDDVNSVSRRSEPVVLTGAQVPALASTSATEVVGVRH